MLLRQNLSGIGVVVLVVCALTFGIALQIKDTTRIVNTQRLRGTIETVLMQPASPKMLVNVGVSYKYGVRLRDNNALVFVDEDMPRLIGSEVALERQHHEDGFDVYRLLND